MSTVLNTFLMLNMALAQTATPLTPADSAPKAEAIAAQVETTYANFKDISMDFLQSYLQKARGKTSMEGGKLYAKRPRMLRWDYLQPKQKFFVSDGTIAYFYIVEDAQIIKDKNFAKNKLNSALGFLWGEGQLASSFNTSFCELGSNKICPTGATCYCLKLLPKEALAEVEEIRLIVSDKSFLVHGAIMADAVGNETTYHFTNIKTNGDLTADWFKFQVPTGVTVLEQGSK